MESKEVGKQKEMLTCLTKYLLDFMFYSGIAVTLTLPVSLKFVGKYLERVADHYWEPSRGHAPHESYGRVAIAGLAVCPSRPHYCR